MKTDRKISIPVALMMLLVMLTMTSNLLMNAMSAPRYCLLLVVVVIAYIAVGTLIIYRDSFTLIWICAFTVAFLGYMRTVSTVALVDIMGLFVAMGMALFYPKVDYNYVRFQKVIYNFSLFYAFGVLLQAFMPSVFRIILQAFPSGVSTAILNGVDELGISAVRGFTTNSGFAAGYLCCGIMASLALYTASGKRNVPKILGIAILFFALIYTGKRGPTLFLVISLLFAYLISGEGSKKVKRFFTILIILLSVVAIFLSLGNLLSKIPLVGEILSTISGIASGDDVTSLRTSLYSWAIRLFKQHPLFGIGWDQFRTTTVGNVTYSKSLDTHNIYLQLLCESGVVGFSVFITLFIKFWLLVKQEYIQCVQEKDNAWHGPILFAFLYQTFFLLYGLTGNVLYDQQYQVLYGFTCAIILAYRFQYRNGKEF